VVFVVKFTFLRLLSASSPILETWNFHAVSFLLATREESVILINEPLSRKPGANASSTKRF
jgi:hypothetical protein